MDGLHSHLISVPVVRGVRQRIRALGTAFLFAVLVCGAYAAEKEIVVAQVAPFSGPVSFYARETQLGAAAYFAAVNARGGVRGAKIRFVTRDDGLDPTKTVALFREVAGGEAPVAFMFPVGPASIEAIVRLKLPQDLGIPVLGWIPPMYKLRSPVNPFVFHIGQGDDAEVAKLVEHIATLGMKELGVVFWNDPAIRDVVQIVEQEAARRRLTIKILLPTETAGKADLKEVAKTLMTINPPAVVVMLPVGETAQLVANLREAKSRMWVYGPSYNESGTLYEAAGQENAVGVSVSQLVPNPFNRSIRLVGDYQDHMRAYAPAGTRWSSLSLEGYVAAKVLVEAIDRAGPTPTAARVRDQLEGLRHFDLGGLTISYGPGQHVGLRFLDIGVVTRGGKLLY